MKCQKCGKNEVNFHYSSNVNGCVTETYLCSSCAAESGYNLNKMLDFDSFFGSDPFAGFMFPTRGISGFLPMAVPVVRANTMFPGQLFDLLTTQPGMSKINQETPCKCGCGKTGVNYTGVDNTGIEVDEEMSKRRELNAQMRIAIENEEFEKAAELRDKIKELEAKKTRDTVSPPETEGSPETGRSTKCDSETTSQDSPPVQ